MVKRLELSVCGCGSFFCVGSRFFGLFLRNTNNLSSKSYLEAIPYSQFGVRDRGNALNCHKTHAMNTSLLNCGTLRREWANMTNQPLDAERDLQVRVSLDAVRRSHANLTTLKKC